MTYWLSSHISSYNTLVITSSAWNGAYGTCHSCACRVCAQARAKGAHLGRLTPYWAITYWLLCHINHHCRIRPHTDNSSRHRRACTALTGSYLARPAPNSLQQPQQFKLQSHVLACYVASPIYTGSISALYRHRPALYRLYISIADGMSVARVWACWYSK